MQTTVVVTRNSLKTAYTRRMSVHFRQAVPADFWGKTVTETPPRGVLSRAGISEEQTRSPLTAKQRRTAAVPQSHWPSLRPTPPARLGKIAYADGAHSDMATKPKGLVERLAAGESVVVAEGYVFEFERRGYLKAGAFVPEVVLEKPELVRALHEEFVHAGSDVVLAFTYYGHRKKLQVIGRESDLEELNRRALRIAREVADATGTLMAGNLCNSTVYQKDDPAAIEEVRAMFKEQVEWALQGGADFMVAETFSELGEAMLALEVIKQYGQGLPAVVSFILHGQNTTYDGVPYAEACRRLEEAGAAVVGFNCGRGPRTMLPLLQEIRAACKGPISALPVPYRTTPEEPTFQSLKDPETGAKVFPVDLPALACTRSQVVEFARAARDLGVQYVGLCCGNASHYLREVALVYGRSPPAARYSPDMSQHFIWGEGKQNYYKSSSLRNFIGGD